MGVENNECIIATTWDHKAMAKIGEWIESVEPQEFRGLFVIVPSLCNGKQTVLMAPDGSKKGWRGAKEGERIRNEFLDKLKSFDYEDGSNPFDFVEVGYGDFGQKVLRGNCSNKYDDSEYCGG